MSTVIDMSEDERFVFCFRTDGRTENGFPAVLPFDVRRDSKQKIVQRFLAVEDWIVENEIEAALAWGPAHHPAARAGREVDVGFWFADVSYAVQCVLMFDTVNRESF